MGDDGWRTITLRFLSAAEIAYVIKIYLAIYIT
jgi:hypothetical protein